MTREEKMVELLGDLIETAKTAQFDYETFVLLGGGTVDLTDLTKAFAAFVRNLTPDGRRGVKSLLRDLL